MSSSTATGSSSRSQMIRPSSPNDWEPYKEAITQLYEEVRLKDVIKEMERSYNFKATYGKLDTSKREHLLRYIPYKREAVQDTDQEMVSRHKVHKGAGIPGHDQDEEEEREGESAKRHQVYTSRTADRLKGYCAV